MTTGREAHCLHCQSHIDYADMLMMDLEIKDRRVRELERKVYRLEHAEVEKKIPNSLAEEIAEFLNEWDELRRQYFKGCKKVPIGPDSTRAQRYRKARKNWSHDELMKCVRGVALSDFHTSDRDYFEPKSFLKEDERIMAHIDRFEAAEALRKAGFEDERFIRNAVQKVKDYKPVDWDAPVVCPDCEYERCRCGSLSEMAA